MPWLMPAFDGIEGGGTVCSCRKNTASGLPLREQSYEDVGASHFAAPGALDVDGHALDDSLETGGGLRVDHAVDRVGELVIQEIVRLARSRSTSTAHAWAPAVASS